MAEKKYTVEERKEKKEKEDSGQAQEPGPEEECQETEGSEKPALRTVRKYMYGSMAAGLIPAPILDLKEIIFKFSQICRIQVGIRFRVIDHSSKLPIH